MNPNYNHDASLEQAQTFIKNIFGDVDFPHDANPLLVLAPVGSKHVRPAWCASIDEMAAAAARHARSNRLYFTLGLQNRKIVAKRNRYGVGNQDEVQYVIGVGLDIDFKADGHATDNNQKYPPTAEDCRAIIDGLPIPPTMIITTGGGLQPVWVYNEPFDTRTPDEHRRAKVAQMAWFETVKAHMAARGWFIDSGNGFLCKQLRLPGGHRLKGDDCRLITVEVTGRKYDISDIEQHAEPGAVRMASHYTGGKVGTPITDNEEDAATMRKLTEIALEQIHRYEPAAVDDRDFWLKAGFAIKRIGGDDESNFVLWDAWSQKSSKYDSEDAARVWASMAPQRASIASLVSKAERLSPTNELESLADQPVQCDAGESEPSDEPGDEHEDLRTAAAELQEAWKLGDRDRKSGRYIFSPNRTWPTAERYVKHFHTRDDVPTLVTHQGVMRVWSAGRYAAIEDSAVRASVHKWLNDALQPRERNGYITFEPFPANPRNASATVETIQSFTHQPSDLNPPAWIHGAPPIELPDPRFLVVAENGVFNLAAPDPYAKVCEATPRLFTTHSIACSLSEDVAEPVEWLRFLASVWPDDQQSIDTLQEWFGYSLTSATHLQKMLLIAGPPRSGKGTIARILTALLGRDNVAGPTLASFGTNFGLWPLIGRALAIISDARLSGRNDPAAIVERLLSISGEDTLTIDRKHAEPVSVRLTSRIMILTNELPRFSDASGALASRFILLGMNNSFLNREDTGLEGRLMPELPAIFKWAVEGFVRLIERGHFVQPESASDLRDELADLGSPVRAFIEDSTETDPAAQVTVREMFDAWCAWCHEHGNDRHGDQQSFGRELRSALPGLRPRQVRFGGKRVRVYDGLRLTYAAAEAAAVERGRRNGKTQPEAEYAY